MKLPDSGMRGERKPSPLISLIPFIALVACLFFVIRIFGADALDGASQVALLFASAVTVAIAMPVYGVSWKSLEEGIADNMKSVGTALVVLILIGAISGSWMVSGVVPTLICYGLKVIAPKIFLFAACIICALVSLITGSSWTTIATIGVALIGIGTAQGYSPGWTAGAIISGAYFGDKISPLSDTTVLASSSCETPLFTHIRYMLITTVPSLCIALTVFLIVSLTHNPSDSAGIAEFSRSLNAAYNISPWLLLVPALTVVFIVLRLPAMVTLFLAALMAGITSLVAQPQVISYIAGSEVLDFASGFKGLMISLYGTTSVPTGNEMLDSLVCTTGMTGMLPTVFLIICALVFGGVLSGSGMIQSITGALTKRMSSRTSLVSTTVATGLFSNMVTGDQYLSVILTSRLYKKLFKDKGYESRLLSRTVEDSVTVTSVLVPWNTCGMTQSTVLKVSTFEYLPYCLFNLISPLMSIAVAITGYRIIHHGKTSDARE